MQLNFKPPGPVAAAFLADRSEVSAIMGPMGSGKTSAVMMKFCQLAAEQRQSPRDGVRYTKVGVVRETTKNLARTTIKSIKGWFGNTGRWFGGGSTGETLSYEVRFLLADKSIAQITFEFIGLDGNNIEDMAKGWELTHYWLNEADLLEADIKQYLDGRVGRFPSIIDGGPTLYCGIMDFNAPDTENYCYQLFEEQDVEGHKLFVQPSGLSPHAENVQNLPEGYYERMQRGKETWWIRRNIKNQYGFSREGEPVYEDYVDDLHCARDKIAPIAGIPIKLHADAALHPGVVFMQTAGNGQKRILDEIYLDGGAVQLGAAIRQHMAKEYPGFRFIGGLVDPTADKRDEKDSEGESWIDTLNRELGLKGPERFRPAPTNDPLKRRDAVKLYMNRLVDGGQPALIVSPKAKVARKGFNSTYRFKKRSNGSIDDSPEKAHPVSDIHDAIQYGCLDDGGYEEVSAKEDRKDRAKNFKPRIARTEVPI